MSKSEAIQQYKELEKKVKTCESDLIQMQEVSTWKIDFTDIFFLKYFIYLFFLLKQDLSSAERARRAAEAERDDLQEEINSHAGKGSLMSDEKRRLDARIGKKLLYFFFSSKIGTWGTSSPEIWYSGKRNQPKFWKIIKYVKNSTKIEEKPCKTWISTRKSEFLSDRK